MGCGCFTIEENNQKGRKTETKIKKEIPKKDIINFRAIKINKNRVNKIDKKNIEIDDTQKNFIEQARKENNKYRKLHQAEPLENDDYLCKRALILAKQFLKGEPFDIENLLYSNREDLGMNALKSEEELNGEQLMKRWYEEINNYNFKEQQQELECNNFTQMIWKASKKIGIGYYCLPEEIKTTKNNTNQNQNQNIEKNEENKKKKFYYIALYYPAGNIPNEYEKNVLEKIITTSPASDALQKNEGKQNNKDKKTENEISFQKTLHNSVNNPISEKNGLIFDKNNFQNYNDNKTEIDNDRIDNAPEINNNIS